MATRLGRFSAFLRRHFQTISSVEVKMVDIDNVESIVVIYDWATLREDKDYDEVAESILAECQDKTDAEGGACRFKIDLRDSDGKVFASTVQKLVSTETPDDPIGIGLTGANSASQQLVRTNEGLIRMLISLLGTFHRGYQAMIADQRKEIQELRAREKQTAETAHNLIIGEMKDLGKEVTNPAMDKLVELGNKILPVVLQQAKGGEIPSED